ncbi:hypothetical protein ACVXZ4_04195 [Lacisediminihabitans sp. FW035]
MNGNGLSDAAFAKLKSSLAKSAGEEAAVRIRKVLANENIIDEHSVDAVRSVLSTWGTDRKLREFVGDDVAWDSAVAAVFEYRELLKSEVGRTGMLVRKAAALIVGVAEAGEAKAVGLGGQARISDARARMVTAVVGVEIMRSIWELRMDTAISPAERIAAQMLTKRDDVGLALRWATDSGIFTVRGTHAGSPRRSIRSLTEPAFRCAVLHYERAINSLVEAITGTPTDVISILETERAERSARHPVESEEHGEIDERQEARKARARMQRAIAASNATTPRGVMRGLNREVVGGVAADLIIGADAIAWSASVPRTEGTLNAALWQSMLRSSLGIKASKNVTSARLGVFGEKVIQRLNEGQRLAEMLSPLGTWDGWARREARLAAWEAGKADRTAANREWSGMKDAAEQTLNSLVTVTGRLPLGTDSEDDQNDWLVRAQEVVAEALPSMSTDLATMTRKRLARRLELRSYDREVAQQAAHYVFPILERAVEVVV